MTATLEDLYTALTAIIDRHHTAATGGAHDMLSVAEVSTIESFLEAYEAERP